MLFDNHCFPGSFLICHLLQYLCKFGFLCHGTHCVLQGYFQILFSCIEKLLAFLNVKSIVLPAAVEAESIWTDKFGFERMKPDQVF